jgi:hypothetical protein
MLSCHPASLLDRAVSNSERVRTCALRDGHLPACKRFELVAASEESLGAKRIEDLFQLKSR